MTAEKEKSQYIPATISTPSSAVVTSSSKFHPYTHPYACVIPPLHLSSPQSRTKFTHNLHQVTDDKTVAHGESFLPKSLKRQHRFNLSITLKNSGSVARDHLASERTFLAYLRTSLALTSAGVGMFKRVVSPLMPIFIVSKPLFSCLVACKPFHTSRMREYSPFTNLLTLLVRHWYC